MSNPLDTDAGSELFSSYEAELKLVQADLAQKLDQIPDLSGEPRKAAISQAERALEEADELVRFLFLSPPPSSPSLTNRRQLGQMRLEKQKNIPSSARTRVNQRFRNYETDADAARRRLRALADDRAALLGGRYHDDPNSSSASGGGGGIGDAQREQREQLLRGTDRLDRSSRRLRDSHALALETEAVGAGTLRDLARQRQQIQHTSDMLVQSETYVDRSVKTLRGMARR